MSWVFQHSQAKLGARLVLLAIANHADLHGRNSWASLGQLAEESHLSEREVRYSLRTLERAGEIVEVAISPRRTHVYELPGMATLWEGADIAGADIAGGKVFPQRGQNPSFKGEQNAPEPSRTIHNRPSIRIIFDLFWTAYPRKVGKPKARAAYERAIKRAEPDVILVGAERYRDDPNRSDEFTAHPTTWLNRDGWADDPLPSRRKLPEEVQREEAERIRREKRERTQRFIEEERQRVRGSS